MRQFSLRHLFLLTSIVCLWFGAYAFWRNVFVLALPLYLGLACLAVYLVHSAKDQSTQIERFGLLTVVNIVCGMVGFSYSSVLKLEPFQWATLAFFAEVFFQGSYLCFQCLKLDSAEIRNSVLFLGVLFFMLNFLVAGLMLILFLNSLLSLI